MKKGYAKPIVSFESFAFSSNIAGGCGDIIGIHTQTSSCAVYGTCAEPSGTCKFVDGNISLFYSNFSCEGYPQEDNLGDLCYHVSTDATRMFMS